MLNVLYVDMNSYFASVEQQLRPELRGRPVAVVPVEADTTFVIAASYEAKAFGVRTGTKVGEAKAMCPGLICVKGRPDEYVRLHHEVLAAVDTVLPVASVHSIDEASCRLLGAQKQPDIATDLARRVKQAIRDRAGSEMRCSVGVAPNRLLAKIAADMHKPDGLTVILKQDLPHRLFPLKLTDLPGVGAKMELRLRQAGVGSVEDLCSLDAAGMRRVFRSVLGIEWFHRLRGEDGGERATIRRTIGHSHVLGPHRREDEQSRAVAVRLVTKLGSRARHLGYVADRLVLSVRHLNPEGRRGPPHPDEKWEDHETLDGCNDTPALVRALARMWERKPRARALKIGLTLVGLTPAASATPSLFVKSESGARLSRAMDRIARKYGADAVYPGSMHDAKKSAPRRIAFGNIPDLDLPDVRDEDRD